MHKQKMNEPVKKELLAKLSVKEAMQKIGIGEDLFWTLVKEGKIRIRQISPYKRFVFIDELEEDLRNMPCIK